MPAAALPPTNEVHLDNLPNALSAYNICLALERDAKTDKDRMHARILGYLILHAPGPSSAAVAEVDNAIHSCAGDPETLLELGGYFRLWFIYPFKKYKGRTPITTDHPSRPSFDRLRESLKAEIKEAPKDHREAKAQALIRDGYKCVVTGRYDFIASTESIVDDGAILAAGGGAVNTELAHILPESTYFNVSNTSASSSKKMDYAASVLAVLRRFGYDVEKVNGPKVHSLYNVMTMQKDVHDWFDRLALWFESTNVPNRYRVKTISAIHGPIPREVTFTSPDPVTLPYPSQQLLALHAACAKVAHLSGASEYIDKFDRDADDLDVLATDGSSSNILTHALLKSVSLPVSSVA